MAIALALPSISFRGAIATNGRGSVWVLDLALRTEILKGLKGIALMLKPQKMVVRKKLENIQNFENLIQLPFAKSQ
jgi:hypothetical protein